MKNYVPFLRWWLLNVTISVGMYFLYHFGIVYDVYKADFTYLTWLILAVFSFMSISCGVNTYKYCAGKHIKLDRTLDLGYFLSSKLTSLGMLGTIIAFYYIFKVGFADLDISNAESAQRFSSILAEGVGAAVLTTIAGLAGRTLLDLQYHNLEYAARQKVHSYELGLEERVD